MANVLSFFSPLTANPLIKRVEKSRLRKAASAQRSAMYRDEQADATLAEMAKRFADAGSKFQLFTVNVVKKVTDKRAAVYVNAPVRTFENWDQEKGEALYRDIGANVIFKKASKLTKLHKTTALKVSFRDDAPRLDVVTPDVLDADFVDPEFPTKIILTRPGPADAERPELFVTYDEWTDIGFTRYDYRGNPVSIEGNESGVNPYGRIPFVPFFDYPPDAQFFLPGGADLISSQTAINSAMVNLWRAIEHQSHGQPWSTGLKPQDQLALGPDKVVNLPDGGKLEFASPNTPIEEVLKAVEFLLKNTATTNDLSSNIFEINQRVESGAAKFAENRDLLEARKDDIELWRRYEHQAFELLKVVTNTHAPGTIPEAASLRIDFGEITDDISLSERLKGFQSRVDLGIWSPVDALMADNPDIQSREAALEILQQVSNENAALGRPLAGPVFPTSGEPADD